MRKPLIGVLTWRSGTRFLENGYFRRLVAEGRKLGADVFLFSPNDVLAMGKALRGFIPNELGWVSKEFAWPDVVIDRYRNLKPAADFREYKAFREKAPFLYTNHRMGSKLDVFEVLRKVPGLRRWLPETEPYSREELRRMLGRHKEVYVKPSNGTGGRGILRIQHGAAGYRLLGRDPARRKKAASIRSENGLIHWVESWVQNQNYLIQQGLSLELVPGSVSDIRLLIQKDETGKWDVTGMGMRLGGHKSATSNLHGGGRAQPVSQVLQRHFSGGKTAEIVQECKELAFLTANTLEARYGRMLEFGLDIGVDTEGRVWLIEVNPKPGHNIFAKMGQRATAAKAAQRPIMYAMHLIKQKEASST